MGVQGFVKREGSRLLLDGKPFRFAGPNIYWLGLDENVNGIGWPTPFRVRDALDTAVEMGATVVRSHTLGASCGHPQSVQPSLGEFNEEALRRIDFAMHEAGERGLRLVVPLVCNWNYYHGGRLTFARWRGYDDAGAFYSAPEVVADFKRHVDAIVGRVNTISGVRYSEDPAIMAWELGNELNDAPVAWVSELADYIKSLAPRQLVAHGKQFKLDAGALAVDSLDLLDVHYYPADAGEMAADAATVAAAGKTYMCGEYGWPDCDLEAFVRGAEAGESVTGTLFWSLFGHDDACGYVQHFDGFTVHYPGTAVGEEAERRIGLLRAHAYRMSGRAVPPPGVPPAPVIDGADAGRILFRGVPGGARYTLEKSTAGAAGPWTVVYDRRRAPLAGPWVDPTRAQVARTWYRLKALNQAGAESGYSAVRVSEPF
ncbi:glycoside hydrolase 5 family protein [Cohnella sp. 56]|uniref:glycoside hydrolase 5 family protein n=1 Tax=Cohnella sp. 56 TaxID=3113722 RepID=UPI0030E95466